MQWVWCKLIERYRNRKKAFPWPPAKLRYERRVEVQLVSQCTWQQLHSALCVNSLGRAFAVTLSFELGYFFDNNRGGKSPCAFAKRLTWRPPNLAPLSSTSNWLVCFKGCKGCWCAAIAKAESEGKPAECWLCAFSALDVCQCAGAPLIRTAFRLSGCALAGSCPGV